MGRYANGGTTAVSTPFGSEIGDQVIGNLKSHLGNFKSEISWVKFQIADYVISDFRSGADTYSNVWSRLALLQICQPDSRSYTAAHSFYSVPFKHLPSSSLIGTILAKL